MSRQQPSRSDEQRLATLLANLPGMVYRCANDKDWTMEFVSEGCEPLTGYAAERLTGPGEPTYASLIHPNDRERIWDEVQAALATRSPFHITYRITTAEGDLKWVYEQGTGVFENGVLTALEGFITDISARKEAEARAQAQADRITRIIDHSQAGYFRLDRAGRFVDVNPAWLRMHGYESKDEVIGQPLRMAIEPERWQEAEGMLRSMLAGGVQDTGAFSRVRRDGRTGYHDYSINTVSENGRVIGVEGFLVDTTDQREAEQRYKLISENAADVIWLWDVRADRCTYVSPSVERMRGFTPAEVLAQRFEQAMPPATCQKAKQDLAERFARAAFDESVRDRTEEIDFLHKDGRIVPTETVTKLLLDRTGNVTHIVGVSRDIAVRQRLEEERRLDSEILRHVKSGVLLVRASDGIIVHNNEQASALGGYGERDWSGAVVAQASGPKVRFPLEWPAEVFDSLRRNNEWTGEVEGIRADGESFWCTITVTAFCHRKYGLLWLAVFSDITGQRRAEAGQTQLKERLAQAQRLESIARLAGGVAHDFNNLLTVINGYCDFLLEQMQPGSPLREFAGEIRKAGDHASSLTRQLLAFSRRQVIEPRRLDLNQAVRESLPMLSRLIGEDIRLRTQLDDALGQVMADPGQIQQVIMNLAVNARDAMPEGGTLEIATTQRDCPPGTAEMPAEAAPGMYVVLSVSDTGHGIEEKLRRHIFEPFYTTKETGKGTGLGLSTVYGIIRQSGGWVEVQSQPGTGARFDVYLPRVENGGEAETVPDQPAAAACGGQTVLVVEDQDAVRYFVVSVLRQYGYHVLQAAHAEEALRVAHDYAGEIPLLISDVVLPGMNGKELSERLSVLRPTMKVLLTSGYTADVIATRGVHDERVPLLHKPFGPDVLIAKVARMLAGEPGD